ILLALQFDSYIEGFALRVAIPAVLAIGEIGALPPALEQEIAEHEKRSRSLFENFMQEHGVPLGGDTKTLSSGWLQNAPEGDQVVGSYGRVFDVMWALRIAHRHLRNLRWAQMFWLHGMAAPSKRAPPLLRCRSLSVLAASLYSRSKAERLYPDQLASNCAAICN